MSNTEKKLDALIDALGFDVEVTRTKKGRPYGSLAGSPAYAAVHRFVDGLWYEYDIDYKLTKRNPKQTHSELIIELAQELYKHSVTAGMKMHTLNYNGTTLKYSFESGLMEIVTDD